MKRVIRDLLIILGMILLLMFCSGNNEVHASTSTGMKIKKKQYDEINNILTVSVYLSGGQELSQFNLSMSWGSSAPNVELINYRGSELTNNVGNDLAIMENAIIPLDKENSECSSNSLTLTSVERPTTETISEDTLICYIKFKIKNTEGKHILEEDLNSYFNITTIQVDSIEIDGIESELTIDDMSITPNELNIDNPGFDGKGTNKNEYNNGDIVNLISGLLEITYNNSFIREIDLASGTITIKDGSGENVNTVNISETTFNVTKQWTADIRKQYVEIDYKGIKKQLPIIIKDSIENITFYPPKKLTYIYGENLDTIGNETDNQDAKVHIKMANKDTVDIYTLQELINDKKATVNNFDSTAGLFKTIKQNIEVIFNFTEYNFTQTENFEVTIIDEIKNKELKAPTKKTYAYGREDLNLDGGQIEYEYTSTEITGNKKIVKLTDSSVTVTEENGSAFDNTVVGTRLLNVYDNGALIGTYEITVYDEVDRLEWNIKPKQTYEYGDILDLTNGDKSNLLDGSINIIYTRPERQEEISLKNINIKVTEINGTEFDSTNIKSRNLKVTYSYIENGVSKSKEILYEINFNNPIKNIELNDDQMTILYGYKITNNDLNKYKIIITRAPGNIKEELDVTLDMLLYEQKQRTIFDSSGLPVGSHIIKINYTYTFAGQTESGQFELNLTVENYLDHIELSNDSITINCNEDLLNALNDDYKIIPKMANGDNDVPATVNLKDYIDISNVNLQKEGTYIANVNYKGKEATFKIIVEDPILNIKLEDEEKEKIQKVYKYNEELILNGAKLTLVRASGEEKIDLTREMIQKFNLKEIGIQSLDIEYKGKKLENAFEVEVQDYIIDIVLVKPNKTEYLPGEKLDLTGATVQTLSASGKLGIAEPVTFDMIFGYKEDQMGTQRLTVKYEGFEKTFDVLFNVQTGGRICQGL